MKVGVVRFPGTNCEFDTVYACEKLGASVELLWHKELSIKKGTDLIVIAGGFSYGDYLRSGAIARFSPIMNAVVTFARQGGLVLGICNGFQVLTEVGLLPGALHRNSTLHFVSKHHHVKVVNNNNLFLKELSSSSILNIPIAHHDGNYFTDKNTLQEMYANEQVLLTYCNAQGNEQNPNGSVDAIAGVCNKDKNVFGLMPHPERAMEASLGSSGESDG